MISASSGRVLITVLVSGMTRLANCSTVLRSRGTWIRARSITEEDFAAHVEAIGEERMVAGVSFSIGDRKAVTLEWVQSAPTRSAQTVDAPERLFAQRFESSSKRTARKPESSPRWK
jgi:hypothetical protein